MLFPGISGIPAVSPGGNHADSNQQWLGRVAPLAFRVNAGNSLRKKRLIAHRGHGLESRESNGCADVP